MKRGVIPKRIMFAVLNCKLDVPANKPSNKARKKRLDSFTPLLLKNFNHAKPPVIIQVINPSCIDVPRDNPKIKPGIGSRVAPKGLRFQ